MKSIKDYPVSELKLIYQILHSQIQENFDLMDSALMHDLQKILQTLASNDGVDVSMHSDWSAWLNNASVT